MASSSSATPVSPTPQPGPGERSETTEAAPTASTKAVVNTSAVRFSARGKATPVAPSPFSDDSGDPREGFIFPLMDPWYESSPLFPPRSFDFSFPAKDWDWTVSGSEVAMDQA